jgi:predicted dehydrogenase
MAKNTRRNFLKRAAAASGALVGAPAILSARTETMQRTTPTFSANDQVNLAVIGAGGMGVVDSQTALRIPGVRMVAACDLYDGRLAAAKDRWGKDIMTTRDYREVLARPDVDAVIIGTPDHWHKEISVAALEAGKGVYCEKPMVHSIGEGEAVVAAQNSTGKTFQVGSQGMSSLGNEKARELFQQGAIGQLVYAEGFWARNSPTGAWQYAIPKDASPKTVDWDRYVSNTTKRDFDPLRFFRWRNYRDYGTGMSGDLYVHLFSSLHFVTSSIGPRQVISTGGLRYWKDGREVPDVQLGMFDYGEQEGHPPFNLSLRCNFVDGVSGSTYLRLVGTEGAMDITWTDVYLRKNLVSDPLDPFLQNKSSEGAVGGEPRKMMLPPKEMHYTVQKGYKGAHYDHFNNFFNGVRHGKAVMEDAVFGYRAAAPALLCNDSYFERKIVNWDPVNMKVV